MFGGAESPGTSNATEEWNGSSWTSGGNLGTARYQLSGNNVGTQTAGLCVGGYVPGGGASALVEEYNGSSWTAGGALPTAEGVAARYGLQTAATIAGGGPGPAPNTTARQYDGSAWTTIASIATGRLFVSGCGSNSTGLIFGGNPALSATEEFNIPVETATVSVS